MNKTIRILLILIVFTSCHSQEKKMSEKDRLDLLLQVWQHVNENYFDENFNGINWNNTYTEYKDKIEACNNTDSLFLLLNQMLFQLNSSHCGVGLLSGLDKAISPYLFKNGEVGIDVRIIDAKIIITQVKENTPAAIANIKPGYCIKTINGLSLSDIEQQVEYKPPFNDRNHTFHLTTEVLRHIYGEAGTELKMEFIKENEQVYSETLIRTNRLNATQLGGGMPPAFLESESRLLTDNIAYLSFNAFNPADLAHVFHSFEKVSDSEALIIDLRGNDGGSIEAMKLLLGRFISERKKYGTYINRNERNEDFIEPRGRKYNGKLVLLVDEMSISGAENMAGIVQTFNIGKVIGKRTPGQMLWGNGYLINDNIALVLPIYKLEYPNGFNPENTGITPNVEVPLNRGDLLKGKDTQIEKAITYLNTVSHSNNNDYE